MNQPPDHVIAKAVELTNRVTCQHSRRGAVIWDPETDALYFGGWNGPPRGRSCDGSEACVATCAMRCVHAEARALRLVWASTMFGDARIGVEFGFASQDEVPRLELVHVKVVDGKIVPGKGPCCAQCSKEVLESGIAAVWLYQADSALEPGAAAQQMLPAGHPGAWPSWIRWPAKMFDEQSRKACGVY